jgi:CMP-N,N'-diacetyllegionaminic acid synthase
MIKDKTILAIIPARAGSKGLPGKNMKLLCGRPLIGWTIEKAQKSHHLDEILVTTDSQEIAEFSRQCGVSVPFMRPPHLATDLASTYEVIRHAVSYYQISAMRQFDYIVLLEPTSPLREDDDIDRMLIALSDRDADFDAIVSIGKVTEHPAIMKHMNGVRIEPFCPQLTQETRRQDQAPAYFPYGVAYIAKTATLLEENTFYAHRCMGFPIKRYQNYEIDDIFDFLCVENVMKHERGVA